MHIDLILFCLILFINLIYIHIAIHIAIDIAINKILYICYKS